MMAPTYIEASLISQRDRLRHLQLHSQRLDAIKHRQAGLKRFASEPRIRSNAGQAQVAAQIEAGNRLLMLKLLAIDRRKRSDCLDGSESLRSLNDVFRRRQSHEIAQANAKLALRLIRTPCEVSHKQLAKQYQSSLKYKQLTSRVLQVDRVTKTLCLVKQGTNRLWKQRAKSVLRLDSGKSQFSVKL